jgi:hypothetical protein
MAETSKEHIILPINIFTVDGLLIQQLLKF